MRNGLFEVAPQGVLTLTLGVIFGTLGVSRLRYSPDELGDATYGISVFVLVGLCLLLTLLTIGLFVL